MKIPMRIWEAMSVPLLITAILLLILILIMSDEARGEDTVDGFLWNVGRCDDKPTVLSDLGPFPMNTVHVFTVKVSKGDDLSKGDNYCGATFLRPALQPPIRFDAGDSGEFSVNLSAGKVGQVKWKGGGSDDRLEFRWRRTQFHVMP